MIYNKGLGGRLGFVLLWMISATWTIPSDLSMLEGISVGLLISAGIWLYLFYGGN